MPASSPQADSAALSDAEYLDAIEANAADVRGIMKRAAILGDANALATLLNLHDAAMSQWRSYWAFTLSSLRAAQGGNGGA